MRVQTSFEKMAQRINGGIFTFFFVAIRVIIGIFCIVAFMMAMESYLHPFQGDWGGEPESVYQMEPEKRITLREATGVSVTIAFGLVGISFILGLFIRPAAILAMVTGLFVINDSFNKPGHFAELVIGIVFVLVLGLFAAGGAGHIFGLDGIIHRNIRRPGRVTKFLFG